MLVPLPESPHVDIDRWLLPLPVELIIRILSLVSDFKDIVICSGVSRQFREIVETSIPLQYIVELGLCCLVDSERGDMTTAERLYRLRERERDWSTLNWKSTSSLPVGKKYIFWELCGGIFAGSYRSQYITLPRRLAFDLIDVLDLGRPDKDDQMKLITLERPCCNFSIDPGQNLLILVEDPPHSMPKVWTMHIRSLADADSTHAGAASSTIEVMVAHECWKRGLGAIETQILGNVVLFTQRRGPGLSGSISVLDWTTGNMTFLVYPVLGDWCCTLVSENEVLVAQRPSFRSQPCLELYRVNPLCKWNFGRTTYLLPFGGVEKTWRPETCYNPASYTETPQSTSRVSRPFMPPPEPCLVAFRFAPSTLVGTRHLNFSLDMFLLPEKLKGYDGTDGVVEWGVWGPESTRWFRDVLPSNWERNIHGYRAVLPEKNTILDFNPNFWTEGDDGVVTQPSHLPLDTLSRNNVVSSLPYRAIRASQPFGTGNAMLDDDLVCVETDPDDAGMIKALRVLSF